MLGLKHGVVEDIIIISQRNLRTLDEKFAFSVLNPPLAKSF